MGCDSTAVLNDPMELSSADWLPLAPLLSPNVLPITTTLPTTLTIPLFILV